MDQQVQENITIGIQPSASSVKKKKKRLLMNFASPSGIEMPDALHFLSSLAGITDDTAEGEKTLQEPFGFQVIPNVDPDDEELLEELGISAKDIGYPEFRSGSLGELGKWLYRKNLCEPGGYCGVYIVVNKIAGKRRKAENVKEVRALFIELDHGGMTAAHVAGFVKRFKPSLVVESSPGKLHVYWLLETAGVPKKQKEWRLEKFPQLQRLLQIRFSELKAGIESIDLPRVLRVPGFQHLKNPKKPFTCRLLFCNHCYYSVEEVMTFCEIDAEFIEHAKSSGQLSNVGRSKKDFSEFISYDQENYGEYLGAAKNNRSEALFHYAYEHLFKGKGMTLMQGHACLLVANGLNEPPVGKREVKTIVESAYKRYVETYSYVRERVSPADAPKVFTNHRSDAIAEEASSYTNGISHEDIPTLKDLKTGFEFKDRKSEDGKSEDRKSEDRKIKTGKAQEVEDTEGEDDTEAVEEDTVEEKDIYTYNTNSVKFTNPASDSALAERLVQLFADVLRYSPSMGFYFYYKGLWRNGGNTQEGKMIACSHFERVLASVPYEGRVMAYFTDERGRFQMQQWKTYTKDMLSYGKMEIVLKCLTNRFELICTPHEFDTALGYLPTRSGIVDMRNGKIIPHVESKHLKFTRCIDHVWKPEAWAELVQEAVDSGRDDLDFSNVCPRWVQFVREIMSDDEEMIEYLQKICGLTLAGDTSNQCLWLCYGTGGNGKSIFLNVMTKLLGEFTAEFPTEVLMSHSYSNTAPVLSSLAQAHGKRMVTVQEVNQGSRWNESQIKSLSGSDTITAKLYFQDPFTYTPQYNVFVRANHRPEITSSDAGIWARFRMIPFLRKFRDTKDQDLYLQDKLVQELPGILQWCVHGYQKYLHQGFEVPRVARLMARDYRIDQNPWVGFLEECCEPVDRCAQGITATSFVETYNRWAKRQGVSSLTAKRASQILRELGIEVKQVRLKNAADDWRVKERRFKIKINKAALAEFRKNSSVSIFSDSEN